MIAELGLIGTPRVEVLKPFYPRDALNVPLPYLVDYYVERA
jgi:hypothetical protein